MLDADPYVESGTKRLIQYREKGRAENSIQRINVDKNVDPSVEKSRDDVASKYGKKKSKSKTKRGNMHALLDKNSNTGAEKALQFI